MLVYICQILNHWQPMSNKDSSVCKRFLHSEIRQKVWFVNIRMLLMHAGSKTVVSLIEGLVWFRFMVFNATFSNISVISWRSVLLVEETWQNHQPASRWQTLSHNTQLHLAWLGFELATLVVIGTDCIGSCKSNYHMTTTAPLVEGY